MPLPKDIANKRKRAGINYSDFWQIRTPELVQYKGDGTYATIHCSNDDVGHNGHILTNRPMVLADLFAINRFEVTIQSGSSDILVGVCDSKIIGESSCLAAVDSSKFSVVLYNVTKGTIHSNCVPNFKCDSCRVGDTVKCVVVPSQKDSVRVAVEFYINEIKVRDVVCPQPDGGCHGVIEFTSAKQEIVIGPPRREELLQVDRYFQIATDFLEHEGDGVYKYVESQIPPDYSQTLAIGTLRSTDRIKPGTPFGTLNIQLLDTGKDSAIAIGLCSENYPTDCLPGWKEDSAGYHVDMSCVLYSADQRETATKLSIGDALQCTVEPVDGNTKEVLVVFRKDGMILSKKTMWCPSSGLYWCIGMMSTGEKVKIVLQRKVIPVELPCGTFNDVWSIPLSYVKHIESGKCVNTDSIEIGTIRSKAPIDPLNARSYFEVKIIKSTSKFINVCIGICEKDFSQTIMPGLSGHSIGYNFHDDSICQSSIFSSTSQKSISVGDVVRCNLKPVDGSPKRVEVSFIVNEVLARSVIEWTPSGGFYAQVGFGPGHTIQVASPLMRPWVLEKQLPEADYDWQEFSLTLESLPDDLRLQLESLRSAEIDGVLALTKEDPMTSVEDTAQPTEPSNSDYFVPSSDHPSYQIFYNVADNEGMIRHYGNVKDKFGCIVSRKQLTEKISYFEVEVMSCCQQGVSIGLSDSRILMNECLGDGVHSIALDSSGQIVGGVDECLARNVTVQDGDVIGCCLQQRNAPEPCNSIGKNHFQINSKWRVLFYHNASFIGESSVPCSMVYFYPTVCLMDQTSSVRINLKYGLKPESYFDNYIVTNDFHNVPTATSCYGSANWKPIQNSSIHEDGKDVLLMLSTDGSGGKETSQTAIVQNEVSFSLNDSYFEIELSNSSHLYKTLLIGASPQITDSNKVHAPGEGDNSVGFLPFTGLVMRNREVALYISDYIVQQTVSHKGGLTIGVGVRLSPSQSKNSVLFFFTIDHQEIGHMICSLPEEGLYPTVSLSYQSQFHPSTKESFITVSKLHFPKLWPFCDSEGSPLGICRRSQSISCFGSTYICDNHDDQLNAVQSCIPICPSNSCFDVGVIHGGKNFGISIGFATSQYPLDQHIGFHFPSIGYHIGTGSIAHNGISTVVSPVYSHRGLRVRCGAIFPDDGSRTSAEIYFMVNNVMIARKLFTIPSCSFYPSIAVHTNAAILDVDMSPRRTPRNLTFSTNWRLLQNIIYADSKLQLMSQTNMGIAQLNESVEYVAFESKSSSWKDGKVLIGFSNCSEFPLQSTVNSSNRSMYFDIIDHSVISVSSGHRKSYECYFPEEIPGCCGCGIKPLVNSPGYALLYFTVNSQVVYSYIINIHGLHIRPSICMVSTSMRLEVDACAKWPPLTGIGLGWGRYQNVKLSEEQYITFCQDKFQKSKLGFAQSSTPFHPGWQYFEVEIMSRDQKKAIAVGLASNSYDMKHWVGWKKQSIAYHADDGRLFVASGLGINCGPKLYQGDVIGCGVRSQSPGDDDMLVNDKVEVFFTVNRSVVGNSKLVSLPPGGLFPTICVESPTEIVDVMFNAQYPSSVHKMSKDWARSVCITQSGNTIEHQLRHRYSSSTKAATVPVGYCQAAVPLTAERGYFEVEIMETMEGSLSVGVAPIQLMTSATITTGFVALCASGLVLKKQSLSDSVSSPHSSAWHCQEKDHIGCRLNFNSLTARCESVSFFKNGMCLTSVSLPDDMTECSLYPTISMHSHRDAVTVLLNVASSVMLNPRRNHVGWLRSERMLITGSVVKYDGSKQMNGVGVAQISMPLCKQNPFYEIEVLDLGEKSCLSIGAASINHPLEMQPGWRTGSVGFHGDDGCLFNATGHGHSFGPVWKVGDFIGLGIRPYNDDVLPGTETQIYFTRNGIEIGHTTAVVPEGGFYPTIGSHSTNEKMKINIDFKMRNIRDTANFNWRIFCGLKLIRNIPTKPSSIVLQFLPLIRRPVGSAFSSIKTIGLAVGYRSFSSELQYFEVQVLKYGRDSKIAIGVVKKDHSPDSVIGWCPGSIAYHTDSGMMYVASTKGTQFGPVIHANDTIGCGVNISPDNPSLCSIFFTWNGSIIGQHVKCSVPAEGFYPAVSLFSSKDQVSVDIDATYKPKISPSDDGAFVGLMNIHNCSYSNGLLVYSGSERGNAHFAIPMNSTRNYFSMSISKMNDNVLIGLVSKDYPASHSPGTHSYSIAYNVGIGKIESALGKARETGTTVKCVKGDNVGCAVVPGDSKPVYFTFYFVVNGNVVHQSKLTQTSNHDLFPVVGFIPHQKNSSVYLNWNDCSFVPTNVL